MPNPLMAPKDDAALEIRPDAHRAQSAQPAKRPEGTPRPSGASPSEASLRDGLARAREAGDEAGERRTSIDLAELLASKFAEPSHAIDLLERALMVEEDGSLRERLVRLLTTVGEPLRAAEALTFLVPFDAPSKAATILAQVAVLRARGGDAAGAAEALREATRLDPEAPELRDLLAKLATKAEERALFWLEAADCHDRAGRDDAAFEHRLRAFDAAPELPRARAALAKVLRARGRDTAADEVDRLHAKARPLSPKDGGPSRREAEVALMREALASGDVEGALIAGLRGGLAAAFEGKDAVSFDDLLARAGLHELLAARLNVRAAGAPLPEKAAILADLARLCEGPIASPERANQAWISALSADPTNQEARHALRAYTNATRDPSPLIEALKKAAENQEASEASREACERELAGLTGLERARQTEPPPALAQDALDRGDFEAALAAFADLLDPSANEMAASHALVLAEKLGASPLRAKALRRLAEVAPAELEARLLLISSEGWETAGDLSTAREIAEASCQVDPTLAPAFAQIASIDARTGDNRCGYTILQALEVSLPSSELYRGLTEHHEREGDALLALQWAGRWRALAPSDPLAWGALCRLAVASRESARLEEVTASLLDLPLPATSVAPLLANALDASADPELALRALEALGPAPELRTPILALASREDARLLHLAWLEATLARGVETPEALPHLLEIGEIRRALGHEVDAARALDRVLDLNPAGLDANLVRAFLVRLEGATGAKRAALLAERLLRGSSEDALVHAAIERTFALGSDPGELSALIPHAERLARGDHALAWVERAIERASQEGARHDGPSLRLAGAVAERLPDPSLWGRLLVALGQPGATAPLAPSSAPEPAASPRIPALALSPTPAPVVTRAPAPIPPLDPPSPDVQAPGSGTARFTIPPLVPGPSAIAPAPASAPQVPPSSARGDSEAALFEALRRGSLESGDRLAERCLAANPPRLRDAVLVRQLQVNIAPGNRERLRLLRDVLTQYGDLAHARAVEHVRTAFDPSAAARPTPPPLAHQAEQPEIVSKLLFRSPVHLGLEALAVICEGAPQLFRRDLASYGHSAAERLPLGSSSPLGRAYTLSARLLGLTRVPVVHARISRKLTWQVALLGQPAVLLSGEAHEETPELRYELGAALAAAMPAHALLVALPRDRATTVLAAIQAAYGPAESPMLRVPAVAAIAETLWQLLPARAERYMRDLCKHAGPAAFEFEGVFEQQKLFTRRAGLFVAGDIDLAISRFLAEERISPAIALGNADGLARLSAMYPAVANLVRLATSPEYAKLRWASPELDASPSSSKTLRSVP